MDVSAPFKIDDQNRLVLRQGGGCLSVFGLPFLGAGLFLILASVGVFSIDDSADPDGFARIFFFLMGLVFTSAGVGLVFGRSFLAVDRPRGAVSKVWSVAGFPFKQQSGQLRGFRAVVMRFEKGHADKADRYPLSLEGNEGVEKFDIVSSFEFGKARDLGTCLADYLLLPFEDHTSLTAMIYDPRKNNDTSAIPADDSRGFVSLPPRPALLRSTISETTDGLEIFIPYPFTFAFHAVLFLAVSIVLINVFPAINKMRHRPFDTPGNEASLFLYGVILFVFLAPLIGAIPYFAKQKRYGTLLKVTAGRLIMEEKTPATSKKRVFDASDILTLDADLFDRQLQPATQNIEPAKSHNPFDPSTGSSTSYGRRRVSFLSATLSRLNKVVLKTRRELVVLGMGLSKNEAVYLCALIRKRLHLKVSA